MARVRQVVETPDAPPGRIDDAFSAVISTTRKAAEAELIQLSGLVSELGAAPVDSALAAFASSIDVSQWVMGEAKALADVVFSGGQASVIRLAVEADGHKREVDDLLSHADPTVRATWDRLNTAPNARRFDEAIQTEISNPGAIRARGLQGVGEVFADSLAQWNMFAELVPVAGHSGVVAAHQAQVAASAAQRRAVATWAGVGVLTLGLTVLVSWAISRPLGRLAEGAMRVSEGGGLARVSFSPRGPREVQVVARALDEAVASLRRVEAQARALATGELDDEALRTTEPGALGDAVQASVEQLSRSLREQEQLRRRLAHQASHDALTGLPNRVGALAAADQALARARRTGQQIALLFIDLDGFKRANDDHGHGIGDLVLRATAERLKEVVRVGDAVARWEATSSW